MLKWPIAEQFQIIAGFRKLTFRESTLETRERVRVYREKV